ncbi:MAG TPA: RNA polymerase subunit sigma-70 [Planctomycetaceae bacterium]|nr:RNA polymerase subunit sigma-70 [Planctomycetaceae bacterium]
MAKDEEITKWVLELGHGDQGAAEHLWNEYFNKLVRLARRKLEGVPLREVDEEDVALSAMHSFCRGLAADKFQALENRVDLWKLLVTITARKATARLRRHFAQKRGGGDIRGESVFQQANDDCGRDDGIGGVLGREPTPELAADVAENCEYYLELLGDDTLRRVALLTLEGFRTEEIAVKLGCVRRTVERKLERIREIWREESEE